MTLRHLLTRSLAALATALLTVAAAANPLISAEQLAVRLAGSDAPLILDTSPQPLHVAGHIEVLSRNPATSLILAVMTPDGSFSSIPMGQSHSNPPRRHT